MSGAKTDNRAWGKSLNDWIEIQEKQGLKGYEYVLDLLGNKPLKILDIGCGTGSFCEQSIKRNMQVTGIDVSAEFIEEAKMRLPEGRFLAGDMEKLPFDNASFDAVCGFNSFQYADDLKSALQETKRVLTNNGQLVILIWAQKDTCEVASFLKSVKERLQPVPSESRNPFSLSEDNTLEKMLDSIGFARVKSDNIASFWHYPDEETAIKGLLSLGALAHTIEHNGIGKTREAIVSSIEPYRQSNGNIIFKNHCKIVSAFNHRQP